MLCILFILSMQLFQESSYLCHLTYCLLPFLYITYSTLNPVLFPFSNSFPWNAFATISSPLRSLITYVHRTVFSTFIITKAFSDQFGRPSFAKKIFYFDTLAWSPPLNLGSSLLFFLSKLIGLRLDSSKIFWKTYLFHLSKE